jgi:F-type H+-transporting ATPase subunit epsilon
VIKFELVTLRGVKLSEEVHEVLLPTLDGQIAVFENHAPLVSIAKTGVISVRRKSDHPDDMLDHYAVTGGVIEIADNVVRVLVDEADHSAEVSEKEAQEALENAKKLYSEAKDQMSIDKAQSMIDRQAVRLRVAELRRRTRR